MIGLVHGALVFQRRWYPDAQRSPHYIEDAASEACPSPDLTAPRRLT